MNKWNVKWIDTANLTRYKQKSIRLKLELTTSTIRCSFDLLSSPLPSIDSLAQTSRKSFESMLTIRPLNAVALAIKSAAVVPEFGLGPTDTANPFGSSMLVIAVCCFRQVMQSSRLFKLFSSFRSQWPWFWLASHNEIGGNGRDLCINRPKEDNCDRFDEVPFKLFMLVTLRSITRHHRKKKSVEVSVHVSNWPFIRSVQKHKRKNDLSTISCDLIRNDRIELRNGCWTIESVRGWRRQS